MNNIIDYKCLKTGCALYSREHNCTLWGDLFEVNKDGEYMFRYSKGSLEYKDFNYVVPDGTAEAVTIRFNDSSGDYGTLMFMGSYNG